MKKFYWRCEKVLELRLNQAQQKQNELLKVTEQLTNAISMLVSRRAVLKQNLLELGSADFSRRRLFFEYLPVDQSQISQMQVKVAELENLQKQKIGELIKARQYCKGLEKLRASAKERFYNEQEKLQQKQADDRTVMKYARGIQAAVN